MTTGGDTLSFGYDGLKRLDRRTSPVLTVDYAYRDISSTQTTTQVAGIAYKNKEGTSEVLPSLGYTYDARGNITKVTSGGTTAKEYVYDSQNQLKSENIYGYQNSTLCSSYTYDTYGNIRKIYNSFNGAYGEEYVFEYGNSDWKDLLTKVTYREDSGTVSSGTLEYDWIGNPVKYFNGHKTWNFTWKFGRQLTNATDGTNVIVNTYDVDGIRQSKTVGSVEHKYTTLDGKVVREEISNGYTVDYFYDNEGKPYKLEVHVGNNTYEGYYVLNQQGDVIAILSSSGTEMVSYCYNAWGKILEETVNETSTGLHLGGCNALKYRGYYYDDETGFYYVSSRYYDPVIGRFINADTTDVLTVSPTSLTDKNLYAYCDNNPVMRKDASGAFWDTALDIISLGASIATVVKDPSDIGAWIGLVADAACLALPFATGGGALVKAFTKSDDTADALKTIKKAASNLNKGDNTVYVAYKGKTLEYVGITNDFNRRKKEWEGIRDIKEYVPGVDREAARFVEQAVIDTFGMEKNGGILSNKINSIGKRNPIYSKYKSFYSAMWR